MFISILQVFWIKIHSLHLCTLGVCLKLCALFGEKVKSKMKECRLWLSLSGKGGIYKQIQNHLLTDDIESKGRDS